VIFRYIPKGLETIGSATYSAHVLPLVHGWLTINPSLRFMQDNTPGHAQLTIKEMRERGICPIFWPPFSPDLNPIETVWNKMKDWMAKYYPEMMSYNELHAGSWSCLGRFSS
jgi:transposase